MLIWCSFFCSDIFSQMNLHVRLKYARVSRYQSIWSKRCLQFSMKMAMACCRTRNSLQSWKIACIADSKWVTTALNTTLNWPTSMKMAFWLFQCSCDHVLAENFGVIFESCSSRCAFNFDFDRTLCPIFDLLGFCVLLFLTKLFVCS